MKSPFKSLFLLLFLAVISFGSCTQTQAPVPQTKETIEVPVIRAVYMGESAFEVPGNVQVSNQIDAPAPDAEVTPAGSEAGGWNWFKTHYGELLILLAGVYELVVRVFPTVRSWSVLSWIIRIITYLVPDKAKEGGQFVGNKVLK